MHDSNASIAAELGAYADKMQKATDAFQRLATAAQADPTGTAGKVSKTLDEAAAKRESTRRPGQPRRGANFTAPSRVSPSKQRKAKRRAQGQARRK